MKTLDRLKQIKALDRYIDSQLDKIKQLEAQALKVTASPLRSDVVKGGNKKSRDDLYIELIEEKEDLKRYTAEAIKQRREFQKQIASVEDIDARSLLQMVYIDQLSIWQICDKMRISRATYYVKLRRAEKHLD